MGLIDDRQLPKLQGYLPCIDAALNLAIDAMIGKKKPQKWGFFIMLLDLLAMLI